FCRVEKLEFAVCSLDGSVAAHDLTQAAAVHVRYVGQVEQQLSLLALDQLVDLALQLDIALTEENIAFHIKNRDVSDLPLCNRHTGLPGVRLNGDVEMQARHYHRRGTLASEPDDGSDVTVDQLLASL